MRTKQFVPGLNNTRRIRFLVNGVGMYCTVRDVFLNMATTQHATAVEEALKEIARIRSGPGAGDQSAMGILMTASNGVNVQVDLV